jgi:2-haloacid dehalogenase
MSEVRAVVFDVGRVLYQWDLRHLFEQLIADPQELDRFLADVVPLEWHFQHDAGRPADEMIAERSALFPHYTEHILAWIERFNDSIPGPVEGSLELVERLHRGGVPLYAITNFGADAWAGFRPTAPIFDLFRDIVVSGIEKLAKPDPAIFALAERRFGFPPGAMLFIDDSPANVDAARRRGWCAHRFVDVRSLTAELATLDLI